MFTIEENVLVHQRGEEFSCSSPQLQSYTRNDKRRLATFPEQKSNYHNCAAEQKNKPANFMGDVSTWELVP